MIQRFYAGGVNGAQLFDQCKNAIEFVQGFGRLVFGQVELRQAGQTFYVGEVKGHMMGCTDEPCKQVFLKKQKRF
jgi:hypothetical protein